MGRYFVPIKTSRARSRYIAYECFSEGKEWDPSVGPNIIIGGSFCGLGWRLALTLGRRSRSAQCCEFTSLLLERIEQLAGVSSPACSLPRRPPATALRATAHVNTRACDNARTGI